MWKNVVQFELFEVKLLKQIIDILNILKQPSNSKNSIYSCLNTLEGLILTYLNSLPDYFIELLDMLYDITQAKEPESLCYDSLLDRAILLGELLCQRPSTELYIELALNEFECLYQYSAFSEEQLLPLVEYLHYSQNNLPVPSELAHLGKFNFTDDHRRLLWLGFAKLSTTEKVQIKAIEFAKLNPEDFILFCEDLSISANSNEKVLIALINRIQSQKISLHKSRNAQIKFELYSLIIQCALPPEGAVNRIIELVCLRLKDYYNFFYMIIQKWPKNKKIYSTILKRLAFDERKNIEAMKPYINRLRLIINNTNF